MAYDTKYFRLTMPCSSFVALVSIVVLQSCSSVSLRKPDPISGSVSIDSEDRPVTSTRTSEQIGGVKASSDVSRSAGAREFGVPSIASPKESGPDDQTSLPPPPKSKIIDAAVQELLLPEFIDTVFGEMLQVPYFTGPGVVARNDVVIKMRTSGELAAADFLELVSNALEEYGVAVVPEDGVYKILDDAALRARMPRFIRARAAPDTPSSLRPLVMFVELDAVTAGDMTTILKQAFPDAKRLKIEPNQRINVLTLSGLSEDVSAAVRIIEEMDELSYAGTQLLRYSPNYVVAKELADQLARMLDIEGWQATSNPSVERTVVAIPVEFTNDIFVFSKSPAALARARFWIEQLDQPVETGDVQQLFVYSVQNVDAKILADTVNSVLSASSDQFSAQFPTSGGEQLGIAPPSPRTGETQIGSNVPGALVVDSISNRLIYSGTASDYRRLKPLLEQLDRPPGEVLILVTVAEVTLSDDTQYGIEFFIDSIGGNEFTANAGTFGTGLGSSGLNVGVFSGNVEVALNAFASNEQVNVLSKPRLVARSGGAARLQVGTDVPVITSQRAASTQDGVGVTDVLQSVEYRKTGVLLSIEPIIFSDNRVDLTISQEVSTAIPNTASPIASPTISNRNLDTQLSIQDGETVVLGGLIQNTTNDGESGIPLLKDIPIAGNLFRSTNVSQTRSELLVLITAYILRDRNDKEGFTDQLIYELERSMLAPDNMETLTRPERKSVFQEEAVEVFRNQ